MTKKPYVVGGALLLLGYLRCWLTGYERSVPPELMQFHRQEQLSRLKELLANRIGTGR